MSYEPIVISLIAPIIVFIFLTLSGQNAEKENHTLIRTSIILGIIAFCISLGLIFFMDTLGLATTKSLKRTLFFSFAVVGFLEELPKMLLFLIVIYRNKTFSSPTRGILYSIAIGLGFVIAENIYFVLANGGLHFTEFGGWMSVPSTIVLAIIMGFMLGYGRFSSSKIIFPTIALGSTSFLHGLYQFAIFSDDNTLLYLTSGIGVLIAILLFRKAVNTDPEEINHFDHKKLNEELEK